MNIKLDTAVYSIEAIIRTANLFRNKAYIFIKTDKAGKNVTVTLKSKKKLSGKNMEVLSGEFMNELLYFTLRCSVSKNNKKIREYIVGRALYSALSASNIVVPEENFDYRADPLNIAVPWEEKHKEKAGIKKLHKDK